MHSQLQVASTLAAQTIGGLNKTPLGGMRHDWRFPGRVRAEEGLGTGEEVFSVSLLHPWTPHLVFNQFPRRNIGTNSDNL